MQKQLGIPQLKGKVKNAEDIETLKNAKANLENMKPSKRRDEKIADIENEIKHIESGSRDKASDLESEREYLMKPLLLREQTAVQKWIAAEENLLTNTNVQDIIQRVNSKVSIQISSGKKMNKYRKGREYEQVHLANLHGGNYIIRDR